MLDERGLQAIAHLLAEMENRMNQKFVQQKQEIIHEVKALMKADVMPKFNLLADGIRTINKKIVPAEAMDET